MNVAMLNRVKAKILETPTSFNMAQWVDTPEGWEQQMEPQQREHFTAPKCGTVACIGGWATLLDRMDMEKVSVLPPKWQGVKAWAAFNEARAPRLVLELTPAEASRLFHVANWPVRFQEEYNIALGEGDFAGAADVACRRIDHFIETDGTDGDERSPNDGDDDWDDDEMPPEPDDE